MIGILIITDAPPPSGAVIGGTLLGVLALVVLVTALFGCLIYYKRRNGRKLNRRYQLLLFMATPMAFLCHANRDLMFFVVVVVSVSFMKHRVICMTWEIERWRCSSLTYIGITSLTIMCVQG